jgi:hypothetical protein
MEIWRVLLILCPSHHGYCANKQNDKKQMRSPFDAFCSQTQQNDHTKKKTKPYSLEMENSNSQF